MTEKAITERQQHWLNHLKASEEAGSSLADYAKANNLKVKDLYQWKTSLAKRRFLSSPNSSFVSVKAKPSSTMYSMILPNGIRLEFQGVFSADLIKTMVSSASQLS